MDSFRSIEKAGPTIDVDVLEDVVRPYTGAVRKAGSSGFLRRLMGLGKVLNHPLIQGSVDVGGRLLAGEPVDEIIPQVGGGMAGSALGAKVGSRFGIPGVLIGGAGGYFLGSYLGGVLDGSIEPQTPMSRTGVSGLTDYLNNIPEDRKSVV